LIDAIGVEPVDLETPVTEGLVRGHVFELPVEALVVTVLAWDRHCDLQLSPLVALAPVVVADMVAGDGYSPLLLLLTGPDGAGFEAVRARLPQLNAMKTDRVDALPKVVSVALRKGAASSRTIHRCAAVVAVVKVVEASTAL